MVGSLESNAAYAAARDGAKAVIGAGGVFGGLELPTIVSIHEQHLWGTARLRAVDPRRPAFAGRANHRDLVKTFLAGCQTAIRVGLNSAADCERSVENQTVRTRINFVSGSN